MPSHLHGVERKPVAGDVAVVKPESHTEPGRPPEDLDARIDKLQAGANTASVHVRNVYVTFLVFGLYLAIIFGSTTHEQLLRESPVTLPLLNVGLPLMGFYWVAPALFVLLHLNLLIQIYLLSQKLHRLDGVLQLVGDVEWADEQRAQLYPFTFSQMLIGRQHNRLMRSLLWLMVWLTVLVLPVVLVLMAQVRFLPYHDALTTMWHRFLVAADVLLILIFWHPIRHPTDQLLTYPRRWLWHQMKALPLALAALTLSLLTFTFPGDTDRPDWGRTSMRHDAEQSPWAEKGLWPDDEEDVGDPMEEWLLAMAPESLIDRSGAQPILWPTRYLFNRLPFLERNLVVRDINLVGSWPTQAQIDQHGETLAWQNFGTPPDLRRRDLRYADLSGSILARGDLQNANLQEANLWGADLESANLSNANLQGASLHSADLRGAHVLATNLHGADLGEAHLHGAFLWNAYLNGAVLSFTSLQGADLTGANLRGAQMIGANLQGTGLTNASLEGAVLWKASLQGADFGRPRFQGGISLDTRFESEDLLAMVEDKIAATDLRGADLRGAHLWRALLDERADSGDRWGLADLRGVDLAPITDLDAWIEEVTRSIGGGETRSRVGERLRAALRDDDRPEVPRFPDEWRSASKAMFDSRDSLPQRLGWGASSWETIDDYDQDLAAFLGELACGADATTHVAQGIAERARSDSIRLYAKHLAARLTGDDCPTGAELPEDLRAGLKELAVELGTTKRELTFHPQAQEPSLDQR
jgi:uncharacterized protein YjbI with pentapeptide repeats